MSNKYDFDTIVDRRKSNSMKWDVTDDVLPMWVADMDFQTAPAIRTALEKRVAHGVFGYTIIPDEWYGAYISWWKNRHSFEIDKDWLVFCTGIVPAISSIVRKLTTPNENVLIMTPVYNIFFNSIINNGARVLESPLLYDGNSYSIDFDDLEEKLSNPQTSLMILCNPHNPVGRIWTRDELARIGELCAQYNVTVISDEIHCDLTEPGKSYVPFQSVSETCKKISITCIAPTKAFNIAGLQTAAVCVPNPFLRHKVWRGLNTDEVAEPNAFAVDATIAAFTEGEEWLDELREYIFANKKYAEEYILENISELKVVPSEATYLMWIDISRVADDSEKFAEFLKDKAGLFVCEGTEYGESGRTFIRLNVACQREILVDGLARLKKGVDECK